MSTEHGTGRDSAAVGVALPASDGAHVHTIWTCEKWMEDAVEWAFRKALAVWDPWVRSCLIANRIDPFDFNTAHDRQVPSDLLRMFKIEPEVEVVPGNLFLNEGIQELWDLAIAAGGTTAYNNANAEIGVGDSATAAAATQTDLQAASNKLFKAMVATYPQRTNQTVDFRSDFTSGEANFAWQEWGVRNGNTRNKNLNRKVESLGTKATGTWTLTASLTIA